MSEFYDVIFENTQNFAEIFKTIVDKRLFMDSRVFEVLYNNVRALMADLGDEFGDDIGYVVEGYIRGYLDALNEADCTQSQYNRMYDLIFSRVPLTYAYYPMGGSIRPPHPQKPHPPHNPGEQPPYEEIPEEEDDPLTDDVELPVEDYIDVDTLTDVGMDAIADTVMDVAADVGMDGGAVE